MASRASGEAIDPIGTGAWTRSRKRSLGEAQLGTMTSNNEDASVAHGNLYRVRGAASGASPIGASQPRMTQIRRLRCDEACDGDGDGDDDDDGDGCEEGNGGWAGDAGDDCDGGAKAAGMVASAAADTMVHQESILENSNTICSFQGGNTHLSRLYSTRATTAKRAESRRKAHALNAARSLLDARTTRSSMVNLSDAVEDDGADEQHTYKPDEDASSDSDFDTTLAALFEREANDSKRIDLLDFDTNVKGADGGIYGCTPSEFQNLVINYYELNGARYNYSNQTTSLAAQYYLRYVSSIATRLQTEKDMKLPPWFFVLAACACQRLAVKLEEGNIEEVPAIQMEPRAAAESGAGEGHDLLNSEGYTFTPEMIVWTEGLVLNELKWEMHVVTPSFFVNALLQKLHHMRCSMQDAAIGRIFLPSIECVEFVLEMARKDLALNTKFRPSVVAAGAIVVAVDVVKRIAVRKSTDTTSASSLDPKSVLLETVREIIIDGAAMRPFTRQQKHQQMSDVHSLDACVSILKKRISSSNKEKESADTKPVVSETTLQLTPSTATASPATAHERATLTPRSSPAIGVIVPEASYNQALSQAFVSEASGALAASPMSARRR